jgi:hypothetical protein
MHPIPNVYERSRFTYCDGSTAAESYVPNRVGAIAPIDDQCHGLYAVFLVQFPQYACKPDSVCAALAVAETYTAGFVVSADKRNQAVLFMTAHLLTMGELAMAESISRATAIASGSVSTPSPSVPGSDTWLGLSPWGLAFQGLVSRNVSRVLVV